MDYKDENTWLMYGDCLERMKEIPDASVDAIICDPPYIGMVNEKWDRKNENWANDFFKTVLQQSKLKLREGGRLVLFGSNSTLSYYYRFSELKHRELITIVKDVRDVSAGRNTSRYKQHVNCSEYVFVATKYAREYSRGLLLNCQKKQGLSSKQINEKLGVKSNGGGMWSIYTGNNSCNQVPTKEQWLKFQSIFNDLPDFESFEEVFNNNLSKSNVLCGFNFRFKGREHPTQKPLDLMKYFIETYTIQGSCVLDFTMGSGTTGVVCKNLGRKFIGIEMDENYFNIAKERILGG